MPGPVSVTVSVAVLPVVADSGRTLVFDAAAPAELVGDRHLLGQMLVNLIENGIRHTPVGTLIAIQVGATAAVVTLVVTDTGPGIPADQRKLALRRFGRLDASRHDEGHGLGLPLIQAIVRLHRGTILLEDAVPGLRVVIALPKG